MSTFGPQNDIPDFATALDIWLAVDVSGSIASSGLQQALEHGIDTLKSLVSKCNDALEVPATLRVLTFSILASWQPIEFTQIPTSLSCGGLTNAIEMFDLLTSELKVKKRGLSYIPPFIILISDGMPTDQFQDALYNFIEAADEADATRACIALGPDASIRFCRDFLKASPYDPILCPTSIDFERGIEVLGSALHALLHRAKGETTSLVFPFTVALPRVVLGVCDAAVCKFGVLRATMVPHLGRDLSAGMLLAYPDSTDDVSPDLEKTLTNAVLTHARAHRLNPAKYISDVKQDLLKAVQQEGLADAVILGIMVASPHQTVIEHHSDLLLGVFPSSTSIDGITSLNGQSITTKLIVVEGPCRGILLSSSSFCASFDYGDEANAMAEEMVGIFDERGETYLVSLGPKWLARATASRKTREELCALAMVFGL